MQTPTSAYRLFNPIFAGKSGGPVLWNPETPSSDLLQYWDDILDPSIANPEILDYRPTLKYNGRPNSNPTNPGGNPAGDLRPYLPGRGYLGDGITTISITGTVTSNKGSTPDNLVGQSGTFVIPSGETVWDIRTTAGARYLCDEGNNVIMYDCEINEYHGQINNVHPNVHTEQNEYSFHNEQGYSIKTRFIGDSRISCTDDVSLIPTGPFTICARFMPQNVSAAGGIAGRYDSVIGGPYMNIGSDGYLYWRIKDGASQTLLKSLATLSLRKAYTVVGTYDGSNVLNLYLDGVLQDSGSAASVSRAAGINFLIGAFYSNPNYVHQMVGMINDVRIYNKVLTQEEAEDYDQGTYPEDTNLQSLWMLDEIEGDVAYNQGSTGINGTYVNTFRQYVPRQETTPTRDIYKAPLKYSGRAQGYGVLKNLPCIISTGSGESISAPHLTGTETIISYEGNSTPSISVGAINFTAGTLYNILLDDGTHYPCSENGGNTLYDISGNGNNAALVNYSLPAIWNTQDTYAYNQQNGFNRRVWFNGIDGQLIVPDLAGATITGSEGNSTPTKTSETTISFTEGICSNLQFSDGRVYPLNDVNPQALIQLRTFENTGPDRLQTANTTPTVTDGSFWYAFNVSHTLSGTFFSKDPTVWIEATGGNITFHASGVTVTKAIPTTDQHHMVFAWYDPDLDALGLSIDNGPQEVVYLAGGVTSNTDPYMFGDKSTTDDPFNGELGFIYAGTSNGFTAAREFLFNNGIMLHPLQITEQDIADHQITNAWAGNETEGTMYDWIGDLHANVISGNPGSTTDRQIAFVRDSSGGNAGYLTGGYNWIDQPVESNPEVAPGRLFLPSLADQIDWVDSVGNLPWAQATAIWPSNYIYGDTTNGRHIITDDQFARLSYNQGIDRFLNYRDDLLDTDLTEAREYTKNI